MPSSKTNTSLEQDSIELPSLEESNDPVPMSEMSLFSADEMSVISAKHLLCDSLLKMIVKDCSFTDFVRDGLLLVMQAVKTEAGSIIEVDQKSKTLFFRAIVGQSSDRLSKFVIPMGKGIVGHVAESKQPMVVEDVEGNRQHLKAIQDAVGFETRNLIAYPILVRGQVYAVLELLNRVAEKQFSTQDLELIQYFCDVFARAVEARMMIAFNKTRSEPGTGDSGQEAKAA